MQLSSKVIFAGAILLALGGWMIGFKDWLDLATPQAFGGLVMIIGSVLSGGLAVHTNGRATSTTTTTTSVPTETQG